MGLKFNKIIVEFFPVSRYNKDSEIELENRTDRGVFMKKRTDVEVIINGKQYTVGGYEGEEYLHKIASYINGKLLEMKQQDAYRLMDAETRNVLMLVNLADDYFKTKKQMEEISASSDTKNSEIFTLRHENIELKTKLEAMRQELTAKKRELVEEQKKVVRLETELREKQGKA